MSSASSKPLAGRVAIITGASAGIGEATAHKLASLGASLVINARRKDRLEAVASELKKSGATIAAVVGDAADPHIIRALFTAAESQLGQPADIVVVNAGRGLKGSPLASDDSEWNEVIQTNVFGAAHLIREAGKRLVALGSNPDQPGADQNAWQRSPRDIVVISSSVGRNISPFSSMYGATKFAISAIAEAVRRELAPKGIRVSCIHPAVVKSEFQEKAGYDPVGFGEFMERIGPVLEPKDIADVIAYIVSLPASVCVNDVMIRPTRQEYP